MHIAGVMPVAGREQQVGAAPAAVRTGKAEVGDPAEPHVVDDAKAVGGRLHARVITLIA
jgi:hypothetical protein